MKKDERDIDRLITESLNEEEAKFYNNLDEQGVFKMWFSLYSGRLGWWAILVSSIQIIFTVLAFYWGYHFFTVDSGLEMARYGAGMFIAMMFTQMLKLWHWMQMDKNSILREMKRLEYQVAVLMEKLSDK